MNETLSSRYTFSDIEERRYREWEAEQLFHGHARSDKVPFTVVIPPPNVTGILHMGHALNNTIQDILIRFQRMRGAEALWMPGTDHAGIATQNVVERKLAREGKSRHDFSREDFLAKVWEWKEDHGSTIIRQLKRLGCACDWQRERFTMDQSYSDAVKEVFVRLYEDGLIYRGNYIINWCPRCETALSDEEAPHEETEGALYHIKYRFDGSDEYLVVATTRPETMLGDTAVAVNPQDERYRRLIGKTLVLPIVERRIRVIGDDFVDPEFGTGCVKVTPAHDPNDYAMGKRHNLDFVVMMHPDGRCNENAGAYAGMDRFAARTALIKDLKAQGLLLKVDPHQHAVGHCYRCHSVVEPYLSKQWFVRMKPLAEPAIAVVKDNTVRFHPERWTKVYLNWMENIQDWCISRQIWWGHRLPVYYCSVCQGQAVQSGGESNASGPERLSDQGVIVSRTRPDSCPRCGTRDLQQDPDVLDTWFSSWLWPFATFGWPFKPVNPSESVGTGLGPARSRNHSAGPVGDGAQQQADLAFFYPTAVLVTAQEIIFFWVARMIMSGLYFMQNIPFRDVHIHGTVRDDTGKKMSKSLGNIIDPLEIIQEYGADALRFSLISITAMGQDVYLSKEKFEFGRNFANKLWNVTRFILMNIPDPDPRADIPSPEALPLAERWILSCFYELVQKVDESLQKYRLNEAAGLLYEFVWHKFCDFYVELAKRSIDQPQTRQVLIYVLERFLRLLHPFMPFISEELWSRIWPDPQRLLRMSWPAADAALFDESAQRQMEQLIELITATRNLRSEQNISPRQQVRVAVYAESAATRQLIVGEQHYWKHLAKIGELFIQAERCPPDNAVSAVAGGCELFLSLADAGIDRDAERKRIQGELVRLRQDITRKESLLQGPFAQKAPAAVVEKERQSLEQLTAEALKLQRLYEDYAT